MDFLIKKGDSKLREDVKKYKEFTNDDFYLLFTDEGIKGYATFDKRIGYLVINELKYELEDERIFDALLRAVAFWGVEHMYQYVIFNPKDNELKERMLKGIFRKYEDNNLLKGIYEAEEIDTNKGIFVDSIWLFSQKCEGSKLDK